MARRPEDFHGITTPEVAKDIALYLELHAIKPGIAPPNEIRSVLKAIYDLGYAIVPQTEYEALKNKKGAFDELM